LSTIRGNQKPTRTLVIFPGALGDFICFLPALSAIANRDSDLKIDLMAKDELVRLSIGRCPVAAGYSIDRREVALLFSDELDAPARVGDLFSSYEKIYSFFGFNNQIFRRNLASACSAQVSFFPFSPVGEGHIASRYLSADGESARLDELPVLKLTDDDLSHARILLDQNGSASGQFWLLIPGSGATRKNWPAQNYIELGHALTGDVAVLIGPGEAALAKLFAAAGLRCLSGLDLAAAAAVAKLSRAFVGNDSGISHLAAAAGARGVALFGPTEPEVWRPLGNVETIRKQPISELRTEEVKNSLQRYV